MYNALQYIIVWLVGRVIIQTLPKHSSRAAQPHDYTLSLIDTINLLAYVFP